MKDLEAWAVDCLKGPKIGCREGEGRKTTLRAIKFGSLLPRQSSESVKVEEYRVEGFYSKHTQHV